MEEFVTLRYLVWLGIHGHQMPGPGGLDDTVAERLEKLHQYERQWEELTFFRRDTVQECVALLGSGCSFGGIGTEDDQHLRLCTLPSRESNLPPRILEPVPLNPKHVNIQAFDSFTDVFIVLSRQVIHVYSDVQTKRDVVFSGMGDPLEFSVMTFKDPSSYHPQAAKQILTCSDVTRMWGGAYCADLSGDKFIYLTSIRYVDIDAPVNPFLLLIWDWRLGKLLAVGCFANVLMHRD